MQHARPLRSSPAPTERHPLDSARATRRFIADSRGEISTAKNVYVAMRTGWFSLPDRVLPRGGRPAVVQDTGFSKTIPVGMGLFAFDTLEQAMAGIERLRVIIAHTRRRLATFPPISSVPTVLTRMLDESSRRCGGAG